MTETAKKIYRSRSDRMIWGVCGGLGKYFNLDSTIFRALFLLLALINGIGVALYVFLAIIIPNEPGKEAAEEAAKKTEGAAGNEKEKIKTEISNQNILGFFIVVLGLILLGGQFFPYYLRWLTWETIGAAAVIIVGIYLITKK